MQHSGHDERRDVVVNEAESAEDCGCAPTARELTALRGPMSRRGAIGLGALGLGALGALGLGVGFGVRKEDPDLVDIRNKGIAASRANGKYKEINDKYFTFDAYGD